MDSICLIYNHKVIESYLLEIMVEFILFDSKPCHYVKQKGKNVNLILIFSILKHGLGL